MELTVRPLTPALWPALEDLFGEHGACNGCWCMYWRIGSAYRKRPRQANKAAFREVVERGPPPACWSVCAMPRTAKPRASPTPAWR